MAGVDVSVPAEVLVELVVPAVEKQEQPAITTEAPPSLESVYKEIAPAAGPATETATEPVVTKKEPTADVTEDALSQSDRRGSSDLAISRKIEIIVENSTAHSDAKDLEKGMSSVSIQAESPLELRRKLEGAVDDDEISRTATPTMDSKGKGPAQRPVESATVDDEDDEDSDDDDDSLDDLDDLLDEFSEGNAAGAGLGESSKAREGEPSLGSLDDDFAKQLQQGMAELLKEMEESPELQTQFDSLVQELDKATASSKDLPATATGSSPAPSSSKKATATARADGTATPAESFHDTIAKTMAQMQKSNTDIDTEMADSSSDDFLAEMLKQMQGAAGEGGSEEDFSTMLMGMMEQLTNKEILYEPMKELDDKFPAWLAENEERQKPEEFAKYKEQASLVREIVAKFDEPTYKDSNEADRTFIVDRMQKMQAAGSPPAELLGDVSQMDGLPQDIDNCPVQ